MGDKLKFYSLRNILEKDAKFNVIIGERSNGKTYACLHYALENYFKTGEQFALVRRLDTEFSGQKGAQLAFRMLENNHWGKNEIKRMSNGRYVGIQYWASAYYFTEMIEDEATGAVKVHRTKDVCGYGFALNQEEAYKEGQYPLITTIVFDEFLTRRYYLTDEFVLFENIISTIKRHRQNIKIFMCGNTINKYCPYFAEMGLYNVRKMQKGDLDVYRYGDTGLVVAVEFSDSPSKKQEIDPYFAFNNPKLKMITTGEWEIDVYPHLKEKYKPNQVLFTYFIDFSDDMLQGNVISGKQGIFMFVHRKTTPIRKPDQDVLFTFEESSNVRHIHNIFRSRIPACQQILAMFREHKVFYSDNEVGEICRNWLMTSRQRAASM